MTLCMENISESVLPARYSNDCMRCVRLSAVFTQLLFWRDQAIGYDRLPLADHASALTLHANIHSSRAAGVMIAARLVLFWLCVVAAGAAMAPKKRHDEDCATARAA